MITFREHADSGYVGRTKENASAHATIAIACNFESAGEKLTRKCVEGYDKVYIPIDINAGLGIDDSIVNFVVKRLNSSNKGNLLENEITLNIAGNGMYTLKGKYRQEDLDEYVYNLLSRVLESKDLRVKISQIRTGGQTGLDESGAKASLRLGIDTLIVCPKGWLYRGLDGNDVRDEKLFKSRFDV